MNKDYRISGDLIIKISQYLLQKPYLEVFSLIEEIKLLEPLESDITNVQEPAIPVTPIISGFPINTYKKTVKN